MTLGVTVALFTVEVIPEVTMVIVIVVDMFIEPVIDDGGIMEPVIVDGGIIVDGLIGLVIVGTLVIVAGTVDIVIVVIIVGIIVVELLVPVDVVLIKVDEAGIQKLESLN